MIEGPKKFSDGSVVEIHGLQSQPQHNGKTCEVTDYNPNKYRYTVRVSRGNEALELSLMEANLRHPSAAGGLTNNFQALSLAVVPGTSSTSSAEAVVGAGGNARRGGGQLLVSDGGDELGWAPRSSDAYSARSRSPRAGEGWGGAGPLITTPNNNAGALIAMPNHNAGALIAMPDRPNALGVPGPTPTGCAGNVKGEPFPAQPVVAGGGSASPKPHPATLGKFTPTKEWQEVPEGVGVPPGLEIRMDMDSGKNFARLIA